MRLRCMHIPPSSLLGIANTGIRMEKKKENQVKRTNPDDHQVGIICHIFSMCYTHTILPIQDGSRQAANPNPVMLLTLPTEFA
jgi:hypothetical protein